MTTQALEDTKSLMSLYMEYVAYSDDNLTDLEGFCTYSSITESQFYDHFDTLLAVEQAIWHYIFDEALATIREDPQYDRFDQHEQLLSFYYTFFESLGLNRDYFLKHLEVRHTLKDKRDIFEEMKPGYMDYVSTTITNSMITGWGIDQVDLVKDVCSRVHQEGLWIHLLCLIDFWHKDTSLGQEKTDIAIEKSVRATIDLIEMTPVKSIVDLGKFLWQERKNK